MHKLGVVLYVDDEPINLRLFTIMFRGVYAIVTKESGIEALEYLENNNNVNAVITDMKMPGISGLEFILKAREKAKNVPFFLLSGYGLTPEIEEAINNNLIDGYFQKPLKKSKIEEELNKYIN